MHTPIPNWLASTPHIPHNALQRSPYHGFIRGMNEWEEMRGHELMTATGPSYNYYPEALVQVLNYLRTACAQINDGTVDRQWGDSPTTYLEVAAYKLGWRLVPFARWVGVQLSRPEIPVDVEAACLSWARKADILWEHLMGMPTARRAKAPEAALVAKQLNEAHGYALRTFDRAWQYGELTDELRPYYSRVIRE
jgi:hypothetical protein